MLAYSNFVSAMFCTITCNANAPLSSILKMLLDLVIDHTISSFANEKILCNSASGFVLFFMTLLPNLYKITKI